MFTACGIMHQRNYRPKHVELNEITNKLLLLYVVGCLYYCKKRHFETIFFECVFSLFSYDQFGHNTYTRQQILGSSTCVCVWSEGEVSPY